MDAAGAKVRRAYPGSIPGSCILSQMEGLKRRKTVRNELLSSPRLKKSDLVRALRESGGVTKKTADTIAEAFPSADGLEHTSVSVLQSLGATEAQAKRIKAAFEFVRMCDAKCRAWSPRIIVPSEAARQALEALNRSIGSRDQEFFVVVLLDTRQKVIDIFGTSVGGISQVEVHPRDIFKHAIQSRAHSVIVAHNHPSGDPSPSFADIELTKRLVDAGKLMGVSVLDSLIITPSGAFTSLAEKGLL